MKKKRLELILQAVEEQNISTQEQIRDYLHAHGVNATQATVSRDIKDLRLAKTKKRNGQSYYEAAQDILDVEERRKQLAILSNSIERIDSAGHTVCVVCSTGMAQGACAALDAIGLEGVVGSIAGDDTIFLLCRSTEVALTVQEAIKEYAAKLDD